MNFPSSATRWLAAAGLAAAASLQPGFAQNVTTGTLSGSVTDDQGGVLRICRR